MLPGALLVEDLEEEDPEDDVGGVTGLRPPRDHISDEVLRHAIRCPEDIRESVGQENLILRPGDR